VADGPWSGAAVVLASVKAEALDSRRRPSVIVNAAVQPVVYLLITVKTADGGPLSVTGLVLAVVLTTMWSCTVWMAGGVLRRERTAGTLARCVSSSRPAYLVLLGKSLGATLVGLGTILLSVLVLVGFLGEPVTVPVPALLALAILVTILSGTALGMVVACLFLLTRHALIWSSALTYPVYILAGLLIPQSHLPVIVRWVPDLISLRWIHEFAIAGAPSAAIVPAVIACALTVGYFAAAQWCLALAITKARRRGSLDLSW
jgi:ABC-2 type transport system permease protein